MIPLLSALFGASAYLTVHHIIVWLRRREEGAYLWVGLWAACSCAYQVSRYQQIVSHDDASMALADWWAFATAVLVLMVLVMTFRAISDVPEPRWPPALLIGVGAVTLVVHASTHLFIATGAESYESLLGGTVRFTRVGPLYLPLLVGYSTLAYVYGMWTVKQSVRLETREKIAFAVGVQGYAALGMNDVLLFSGYVHTLSLFEYGFAAFAVGLSLLLQRRIERLQDQLENEVDRATRSLRGALEEAKAAARAKSQFLANMSHEIRTPLNGVIGTAKLLLDHPLDDHARESVEIIDRCGDSLLSLVNDVLDFSKLDQGAMMLASVPVDVGRLATDTGALFRAQAEAKGVELRVEVAEAAHAPVLGDATRLVQVLRNLVGNAVKFTDAGSVRVLVDAETRGPHRIFQIEIRDTGVGIPVEAQGHLFQHFVQVDASSTRAHGGTGLGLAICKRIVEAMAGTISLTSREGEGTSLRVTLTLPTSTMDELLARRDARPVGDNRGASVLLVEDYPLNQRVARGFLERLGCTVKVADNGQLALDILAKERFDCVLMDCQMPVMDGFEATRRFRAMEESQGRARTRVVALTANVMPEDRRRCLECGMDDYVPKPVDAAALARALRSAAGAPSASPSARVPQSEWLDEAHVRELEALTDDFAVLFAEMLQDTQARLAAIDEALESQSFDALRELAHAAKGAALSLGARRLGEQYGQLEAAARARDVEHTERAVRETRDATTQTEKRFAERRGTR